MPLLFAFIIGLLVGMRSLTPPAVTAGATHLGRLKVASALSWIGRAPVAAIFILAALVELVADKLPAKADRTEPLGIVARTVMGGLTGACVASAGGAGLISGAALGILGGLAGAFGGYQMRTRLVKALGIPDYVIALAEDLMAIGGSVWVVTRF